MDEGNEVLVCASEYVKGKPVFTQEKTNNYGRMCAWFCSLITWIDFHWPFIFNKAQVIVSVKQVEVLKWCVQIC
jgi:hypothetical protein